MLSNVRGAPDANGMEISPHPVVLAERIHILTRSIIKHWDATNQDIPTFDIDAPEIANSATYETLTDDLNEAANDLLLLVNGPKAFIRNLQLSHFELVAYQVALEFKFFDNVPIKGNIHVSELACLAGLDRGIVGRVMRVLVLQKVFKEISQDVFGHTSSSGLLAKNPSLQAALGLQMDEMYKAASSTSDALRKSPEGVSSENTPFSTRFNVSIYDFYKNHPENAARFGEAMGGASLLDSDSLLDLQRCFPWDSLSGGKIVDVGGGHGHVSTFLAEHFATITFTVQDILVPPGLSDGAEIQERVAFQKHDFFHDQPFVGASAYFIKHCLHNYDDSDCVKILKTFVPALERSKPRTPLLINEGVMQEIATRRTQQERTLRHGDICMLVTLGAKERTGSQFRALLKRADPRYEVIQIHGESVTKLIEVHLKV